MYHVSAQGVDERMINVHYYYYGGLLLVLKQSLILSFYFALFCLLDETCFEKDICTYMYISCKFYFNFQKLLVKSINH